MKKTTFVVLTLAVFMAAGCNKVAQTPAGYSSNREAATSTGANTAGSTNTNVEQKNKAATAAPVKSASEQCNDMQCFGENLSACSPTKFDLTSSTITYRYEIIGLPDG